MELCSSATRPRKLFLGNAAGPEPVHQDAVSVPGFLGVINSFDGYVHTKRFDKGIEPGKFFSVELRRDMRFTGPPTEAVRGWGKRNKRFCSGEAAASGGR